MLFVLFAELFFRRCFLLWISKILRPPC